MDVVLAGLVHPQVAVGHALVLGDPVYDHVDVVVPLGGGHVLEPAGDEGRVVLVNGVIVDEGVHGPGGGGGEGGAWGVLGLDGAQGTLIALVEKEVASGLGHQRNDCWVF